LPPPGLTARDQPKPERGLGGIIACGLVYTLIGLVVMKTGTRWIERMMPPVVTGAVVMAIGLNLAPIAVKSVWLTRLKAGWR
jgi:putative pyrimidine permease RutG